MLKSSCQAQPVLTAQARPRSEHTAFCPDTRRTGRHRSDLCLLLASQHQPHPLIAITSCDLLLERAAQLGVAVSLLPVEPGNWPDQPAPAGSLYVWDTPLNATVTAGKLDKANAAFVLQTLTRAAQGCVDGDFAGMITAPVHKGVINEAGIPFSGHTEFLADLTHIHRRS